MFNTNTKRILKKTPLYSAYRYLKERKERPLSQKSYSQCGEDLILSFLFTRMKIRKVTYLDIGANDPVRISNTYFFYKKGGRGVLVEPNLFFCKKIARKRPRDICLNAGIGFGQNRIADFYVMSSHTLSTFSKEEAERYASYGAQKIKEVRKIPLISINEILTKYFPATPNLVSLDIEGWDLQVIQSINFDKFRPQVFCIETITYTENDTEEKITEIIDFMAKKDYFVYADTYINTIFVDKQQWKKGKLYRS